MCSSAVALGRDATRTAAASAAAPALGRVWLRVFVLPNRRVRSWAGRMEHAGRKGSSEAETSEARTARLSREVAHSMEFHKERLAADFPFVKREYLQKFVLMGAVAEKKE